MARITVQETHIAPWIVKKRARPWHAAPLPLRLPWKLAPARHPGLVPRTAERGARTMAAPADDTEWANLSEEYASGMWIKTVSEIPAVTSAMSDW